MYLKSIEIQGFKSFAKKTTLDFKNGITGIVGPNGSGKSNVADALRWVLGEQKVKSLRGSKMEDVIFAGTEKRNPLSFAYVAITFDNSDSQLDIDYQEVKVARKLYRSGESEYFLNGSLVRLKDIRELFYDTGIGKEGYSIIGQGQIDKILQGKSEERRELFDEACGIVKYKKRKTAALKKLENERLNLERVNDITKELERRLPSLKRQSESANNFLMYKTELKSLDINLFLNEAGDLKKKIEECKEKEEIAAKELSERGEMLSKMKAEHENAAERLAKLDNEIEEAKNKISRTEIIRESLLGQINVLNEQISSADESKTRYSERKKELSDSIISCGKEKASLELSITKNAESLKESLKKKEAAAGALSDSRGKIERLSQKSESLKEALIENIQKKGETDAKLQRLSANFEQLEKRMQEIELAATSYLENKNLQAERVNSLSEDFKNQEAKVSKIEDEIASLNGQTQVLKDKEEAANQRISSLRLKEASAKARLESIRNITERYEGYSGAIKEVMALKERKKGIIGVVADIIKTQKEYETAIETALGGSIQNIVTDTETTAKEAIEYLKENRLGRATFLPLKSVKNRGDFKNIQALSEEGAIGLASSLVNVEGRFLDLCDYLLGRILVADNIDNALKIARKYRYSFIIVTLEGELLSRGGAISGGAYKNKSNLLGRRREIEDLEKRIRSYSEDIEKCAKELDLISGQAAEIASASAKLSEKYQEEKIYLNTIQVNLIRAREDEAELSDSYENAGEEEKNARLETEELNVEKESLVGIINENASENAKIKEEITFIDKEMEKEKEAEEALAADEKAADIEISRIKEQQIFLAGSMEACQSNMEKLSKDLAALKESMESSESLAAGRHDEIAQIYASLDRAKKEEESLEIKLADLQDRRLEAKEADGDFFLRHDELSEHISSLDKEIFRLGQLEEKYEERFNSSLDYIWREYELTYNSAADYKTDNPAGPQEMRARISELKNLIRALGTINVGAIEEYALESERFEFLSSQRDDIVKAEENLLKIIEDLDSQMKNSFQAEFKKISAEFSRVFKIMFGGGYGTICLEDEDDILNSDVVITAQPPGKKLQNMMQLSGGEKALTAITVLFAIQNLKPSPFCILDEIEAALDDSNITKFSNYLTMLSGKIQFIVITHRKGTMEACDRLYGITMQEKGVSVLVSVNLEEAKQAASPEDAA